MIILSQKQLNKFWRNVEQKETGCWEWMGAKTKNGYGHMNIFYKNQYAHRISYEIKYGEIPVGMVACHKCDNPACVNPDHIFIGTQKDNIQDMIKKGRNEIVGNMKYPFSKIIEIRDKYNNGEKNYSKLGRIFGISKQYIWFIINNKTRKTR